MQTLVAQRSRLRAYFVHMRALHLLAQGHRPERWWRFRAQPAGCGHPPTHLHSLPLSTDVPTWRAGAAEGGAVVRAGLPGCASLSRSADMAAQVGGGGVDVEADEVPLLAKGHPHEDGRLGVLWLRYVARGGSSVAT